jgi:hypothetical protein
MQYQLVVRFPNELAADLKAECQRTGCPLNEFIRRAVTAALRKVEEQSNATT